MEKKSILLSTIQVTAFTFGIKILGLIKQSVLAAYCGANDETDAFFIATGILVQLCTVIFSAISISFLSIHTKKLVNEGREKANGLVNQVLRIFIPIAIMLSILFYVFAPVFAKIFAPAYSGEKLNDLIFYIRIMSGAFVIWCYYLIINVVLETDKHFLPGKGQGFFQNVFLIIAAIFLYPKFGIVTLVYAFLLSGIMQCILVTVCARKKFKFLFRKIKNEGEVNTLIWLSIPLIVGNAIYEINDIVDKQISTSLGTGNVSLLTYGGTINEIVTGVIVTSVSTVIFSHYATWIAKGEIDRVENNLRKCIEYLTNLIFPIMVMCIIAGDQLVEILYGRGNFGHAEIVGTYSVVVGYAFGFIFQAARANIVKVFYAFQDTKIPMINGVLSVTINVILSLTLSQVIGISGVAVATSIAMFIVTVFLLRSINRYLPNFSIRYSLGECLKGFISGCCALCVVYFLKKVINVNLYVDFCIEGLGCIAIYVIVMVILKSSSILDIYNVVKAKCERE